MLRRATFRAVGSASTACTPASARACAIARAIAPEPVHRSTTTGVVTCEISARASASTSSVLALGAGTPGVDPHFYTAQFGPRESSPSSIDGVTRGLRTNAVGEGGGSAGADREGLRMAAAFTRVSVNSSSGSDNATMAPPDPEAHCPVPGHHGSDDDAEVGGAVDGQPAEGARVHASRPLLQPIDDFHGAYLRCSGHRATREAGAHAPDCSRVAAQRPTHRRHELVDRCVGFDVEQSRYMHRTGSADP